MLMDDISLLGIDKAAVLAALYNASKPQGLGFLQYDPTPMTTDEATLLLEEREYFDYLKGRDMKVDLSGDSFSPYLYDRDNGPGAAERALTYLRNTGKVTEGGIKTAHLRGLEDGIGRA